MSNMPMETTYYIVVDWVIFAKGTFEEMKKKIRQDSAYYDILERNYGSKADIMPSDLYDRCMSAGLYSK
ncbi:MAG: hypothetical protein IK999_13125 [Ruminococcus sp.]|nr:hypothetical protein [Ruminococcus sp.]